MSTKSILKSLKEFANSEVPMDLLLVAVNETKAEMQNRIFNSEKGAKDVQGKGLGNYSNAYANYRKKLGRQVKYKDLELTGALRRELETVRSDDNIKIVIRSESEVKKAKYIEEQEKQTIFALSEEEQKLVGEKANILFSREIEKIIENGINKQ